MSITINNTTINTRLTIIFDADINKNNENDGPVFGSGNTESDVYIDSKVYSNLRSHTEIPSTVHALQCWNNNGTWTYELEHTDNSDNTVYSSQSDLPSWVNNVVIRCEAQDTWQTTYDSTYNAHSDANTEDDSAAKTAASSAADTARVNYLSGNSITY
jgi:cation transport regulator ChaB